MGGTEVAQRPEVFGTYTSGSQFLQQRCFPRSIGPSQQNTFSLRQLKRDVLNQDVVAVAYGKKVDPKGREMDVVDCQCFIEYCLGKSD